MCAKSVEKSFKPVGYEQLWKYIDQKQVELCYELDFVLEKNQCGFWPTLTIKDENGGLTAMMTLVLLSGVFWSYKCSLFLQVCQKLMKKLQAYLSSPSRSMYLQKCSNGWIVTLFLGDILTTTATKLNTKRWTMMAGWSFFQNNPVLSYS